MVLNAGRWLERWGIDWVVRTQECSEQLLECPGRSVKPTKNSTATFLSLQIHWWSGGCGLYNRTLLEKKGWGDTWTTTLGTKAWRKKERKTSNNIYRPAAKWYWFQHCWTEEHHGKPEGMDEATMLMEFEFARNKQEISNGNHCYCPAHVCRLPYEFMLSEGFVTSWETLRDTLRPIAWRFWSHCACAGIIRAGA